MSIILAETSQTTQPIQFSWPFITIEISEIRYPYWQIGIASLFGGIDLGMLRTVHRFEEIFFVRIIGYCPDHIFLIFLIMTGDLEELSLVHVGSMHFLVSYLRL